ncbi:MULTISPECIES: WXG100 family type VII secretion target [Actinoalloteichus]|uniref:WXG100 family type VII secretion target n=1 Tax=Actinoalloteichus fjordicus TaxID=1612552 RepID=A0AAC9PQR8_9PSEU|nr:MULTISPECIES: type VII secretion target [Actinoalloteichus]APU13343.1 hypothetical protein UA74_06350 [Actinoalloteichus fjordicus]APU19293.1 hypothetical protein UA75_06350 [Actinoalloteichus sp. GBA129-24]
MGNDNMEVDPPALRARSPQFDAAADQLEGAGTSIDGIVSTEGECWGGDESGMTFATDYVPAAQAAQENISALVEALRGIKLQLDAAADTWESIDQDAADGFSQMA